MSFIVSFVITGDTLAGFVLIDKDNHPHNFDPEDIENILMVINALVLVLLVVNMTMIKWGLWWEKMAPRCCCGEKAKAEDDHATFVTL